MSQRSDLIGSTIFQSHPEKWSTSSIIGSSISFGAFPQGNVLVQGLSLPLLGTNPSSFSGEMHLVLSGLSGNLQATGYRYYLGVLAGSYGALGSFGSGGSGQILTNSENIIPFTNVLFDTANPAVAIGFNTNSGASSAVTVSGMWLIFSATITSIIPDHGPIKGGTPVVISGEGFSTVTSVTFNGNSATSVVVVNSNTITCVTPPGAPSVFIDVVVNSTDGSISTLPASYQYRNVPFSWTVNGIPSVGGNPPTVPLDYNDPINIVTIPSVGGTPTGPISPGAIPNIIPGSGAIPDGITYPLYITYTPISGSPVTIQIPQNPPGIDPTTPIPIGTPLTLPPLPGINPLIPVVLTGTATEFSGTVVLGLFTITIVNGAGIYVITPGNTADTLYVNSPIDNTTAQVKFPDPFVKTAFIP